MKYIKKGVCGIYGLIRANGNPPSSSEAAKSRWKRFKHKGALTIALKDEQLYLCAYSEVDLNEFSLGTHIEHIEPKSANPRRTFDYKNLVVSAISERSLETLAKEDVFGGHAKQSKFDSKMFISCLNITCENYFCYLSNGRVEPLRQLTNNEKKNAQYTIDLLNLNSPYLVAEREKWIDEIDQLIDEHLDRDMSLDDLKDVHVQPINGKLYPFYSATLQRFK